MAIGLIIIGDEILSGRRVDQHFPKVVQLLAARGLKLDWAEVLADDPARITATLKRTFASDDIVFCCGGIGATPDDHTRQAAADALGLPLVLHEQGKANIQQRIVQMAKDAGNEADLNSAENLHRLKMAEFAQGAALIPNPYNNIAGFALHKHYFVPGFPVMAWPMIEWVLDNHYADLFNREPHLEQSVMVYEAAESALTPLMVAIEAQYPRVKVFSLDHLRPTESRMVVTEADPARRIVRGINAEPAAREYARILGKDPAQLTTFTFAGHPVVVRIGGTHHVRAIQQVDANGDLIFFSAIDEGVVLTLAEPQDMAAHLSRALADLRGQGPAPAILACDCLLRRIEALEKQMTGEISAVLRTHGVVGFSTYGEQVNSMHVNQTMTGVAIYPPEATDGGVL